MLRFNFLLGMIGKLKWGERNMPLLRRTVGASLLSWLFSLSFRSQTFVSVIPAKKRTGICKNYVGYASVQKIFSNKRIYQELQTSAQYFHLLIPADARGVNLCKAIVSSACLNYLVPTPINWGETFNDSGLVAGGSHLAKITGVLDYLNSLESDRDKDLVLMVDGHDVWFQLRPGVLIER
jgi:hypothetical protein